MTFEYAFLITCCLFSLSFFSVLFYSTTNMDTVEEKQVDVNMEMSEQVVDVQATNENQVTLTAEEQEGQKTMQAYDELLEIKEKV